MFDESGFLIGAWQPAKSYPKEKVSPYLVKKRGAKEKMFDVSLSGRSDDYKGVPPDEFIRKLLAGSYPSSATVRMKSPKLIGLSGNGYLIRNMSIDPSLWQAHIHCTSSNVRFSCHAARSCRWF
jgi:hypothetical protein